MSSDFIEFLVLLCRLIKLINLGIGLPRWESGIRSFGDANSAHGPYRRVLSRQSLLICISFVFAPIHQTTRPPRQSTDSLRDTTGFRKFHCGKFASRTGSIRGTFGAAAG